MNEEENKMNLEEESTQNQGNLNDGTNPEAEAAGTAETADEPETADVEEVPQRAMTKKGFVVRVIVIVLLAAALTVLSILTIRSINMVFGSSGNANGAGFDSSDDAGLQSDDESSSNVSVSASDNDEISATAQSDNIITDEQTITGASCSADDEDESALIVRDGGILTLIDSIIEKTAGDSSDTENSEFYGINAGLLVTTGSTATISGTQIETSAAGSNAVFATGTDAKIYISDSQITTTGESSARGLDATYGGYIEADNVTITTSGNSCATLATDRGEGTVTAANSTLTTNGTGSPVIYSTGQITLSDSTGTANASQLVVIEGKNSAAVEGCTITGMGTPNRGDVDQCGVMIYQSMSGDADEGTGTFTAADSALSIDSSSDYYATAPMFFVTNTDAVINLSGTQLEFGSGILLSAAGTSEWGTEGSNGGNVTLNAENQSLSGDIEIDDISTLELNLSSSSYEGTINGDNTAESVVLNIDSSSTLVLTGDSYVSELNDDDSTYSNIDFNGYTLYVDGTAVTG